MAVKASRKYSQTAFEEPLLLNIFDLLPCDLQLYIVTYLDLQDLFYISLSCQHGAFLVLSPENDGYVWKSVANHVVFNNSHEAIQIFKQESKEQKVHNEKEDRKLFQEMSLFEGDSHSTLNAESSGITVELRDKDETLTDASSPTMWRELVRSNLIRWDPDTRTPDTAIHMRNSNKTISCEMRDRWSTIRADRKLEIDRVHCWEYIFDHHDNFGDYNAYRVFVGIERSTYAFTEVGFDKIIGLNSQGISYNVGEHAVHRDHSEHLNDRSILHEKKFVFGTGDTIAIKLDLKSLSSSNTASMYLFKNNEYFMTISDIPTQDILYYPAISVIGCHTVSIRMKNPSILRIDRVKLITDDEDYTTTQRQ